jgi:hypothetical protein
MEPKEPEAEASQDGGAQLALNTNSSIAVETLEQVAAYDVPEEKSPHTREKEIDDKEMGDEIRYISNDEESLHIGKGMTASEKVDNMEEIALYALHVEDDRSLNPWTFRMWFLGKVTRSWTLEFYLTVCRPWIIMLRIRPSHHLQLQTSGDYSYSNVPMRG